MFLGWYKSNTDGEEMSKFVMRYYHHGEARDIEAGIRYCYWHNFLGCFFMLKKHENSLNGVSLTSHWGMSPPQHFMTNDLDSGTSRNADDHEKFLQKICASD